MKRGFSLIELVAVLLLVGVLATAATVSLLPVAEGLMQVRLNATTMQKSRLAYARLTRELTTITNVAAGGVHSLQYVFLDPARTPHARTLTWGGNSGDPLLLNGVPLTDDVADFQLHYYHLPDDGSYSTIWSTNSRIIEVILQSQGTGDLLATRLVPRNILFGGTP